MHSVYLYNAYFSIRYMFIENEINPKPTALQTLDYMFYTSFCGIIIKL